MQPKSIIIRGTGSYTPEKSVSNFDLEKIVDTNDAWIYERSGIRNRRIASDTEYASDMALYASQRAIESAKISVEEIDLIIFTTVTPDKVFPSSACILQTKLGARPNIPCFDLEAACSGFVYGLEVASTMMKSGAYKNALVVSSEKLSSIVDWQDRTTCVLFGDGAGAVILSASDEENVGILGTSLGADGAGGDMLQLPAGGCVMPATEETVKNRLHFVKMDGKEVFKRAVKIMQEKALDVLDTCGITSADIKLLIPHQANIRIIESVAKRLNLPKEKVYVNIEEYGNTSSASIPIALDEVMRDGKIQKGDFVLMVAFGAGLTWGAVLVKIN